MRRRMQIALHYYVRMRRLPNTPTYDAVFNPRVIEVDFNENISAPVSVRMERLADILNMPDIEVKPHILPEEMPWRLTITFCKHLTDTVKREINGYAFKSLFIDHIVSLHLDSVHCSTDGSKTDDSVGYAVVPHDIQHQRKMNKNSSIFTADACTEGNWRRHKP